MRSKKPLPVPIEEIVEKPKACSLDQKIRELGFEIHSRRKDSEPEWKFKGRIYKQSYILATTGVKAGS